ncbi:MAG: hypothetical protein PHV20_04460 [Bacteroidales bacterium]|nr:hypothetical protein [Bacteroidales bacterium]
MNKNIFVIISLTISTILFSCQEKTVYPEVTQLKICNRSFIDASREVLNSAEIHNKSLDSVSEKYNEEIYNLFVVDVFKQTIEEKTDTFFQFTMINKADLNAENKYYGYFMLSDKPFFINSELENSLLNLMFEKLPFKTRFRYLHYIKNQKKSKSNTVTPLVDAKYRTYQYVNGKLIFFREMY